LRGFSGVEAFFRIFIVILCNFTISFDSTQVGDAIHVGFILFPATGEAVEQFLNRTHRDCTPLFESGQINVTQNMSDPKPAA
jgi:hypothetical protein